MVRGLLEGVGGHRTPCGAHRGGGHRTPCGTHRGGGRGFDAEAKLKSTLVPFLTDRSCGTLAFAPVTR
ncbi:hypothetical protein EAO76_00260, partial [Streptomyces sp. sk2.1]